MFVRCHRDRPIRQFLPSRSFVDPFPVGVFPSYADLFVSDWIHVGIRLIVRSVRFRSVVACFGSIVSFRTRLVFLSHPCRSFRLRSCGLDPSSTFPFAFRFLTSTLLGPAASCRWCLPSSSLACCDPSMMEAPHCALANDVKDERLETSSFSGGILPFHSGLVPIRHVRTPIETEHRSDRFQWELRFHRLEGRKNGSPRLGVEKTQPMRIPRGKMTTTTSHRHRR